MYVYKPYPAMRYHATLPPVIVKDPEEEAALGEGWANTPAAFEAKPEVAPEVSEPEAKKKKGKGK